MKKFIISSAITIIVLTSGTSANAQDIAGGAFSKSTRTRVIESPVRENRNVVDVREVSLSAVRHFTRKFKNAENITWVAGENGPSVYFTVDNVKMRSTYDKTGKNEYTLKYYTEAAMPASLRHLVKSSYYDYAIDQVTEVERNNTVYYLVKMQNDTEIVSVKVIDGEVLPYETIQKAK